MSVERQIRINQTSIYRRRPNRYALETIIKQMPGSVTYEYLVGDTWIPGKPTEIPNGKRAVVDSKANFGTILRAYKAYEILSQDNAYTMVRREAVIERLTQPETTLFVPWGVRPKGQLGASEESVLGKIESTRDALNNTGLNTKVLLMPADLYATEVNSQVETNKAAEYFGVVKNEAEAKGFEVKPWSEIRSENQEWYNRLAAELTEPEIVGLVGPNVMNEAAGAASRRSGYDAPQDIKAASLRYLRERLCEAEIVETLYKPIKLSAVSKNKDNFVDRDLPRVYIIPWELQFPWLKK